MVGLFVWMKQEREDVPEGVSKQADVEVGDSAAQGGEVGVVIPEVKTACLDCNCIGSVVNSFISFTCDVSTILLL